MGGGGAPVSAGIGDDIVDDGWGIGVGVGATGVGEATGIVGFCIGVQVGPVLNDGVQGWGRVDVVEGADGVQLGGAVGGVDHGGVYGEVGGLGCGVDVGLVVDEGFG